MRDPMEKSRAKTLLVEIAIGTTLVIIAILYATYGPFGWLPRRKWVTFTMISSGVFGVPVWWYRGCWRHAAFWVSTGALLVLHTIAYSIVLARVKEFPPLLAAISCPLEWLIIFPILRKTVRGYCGPARRGDSAAAVPEHRPGGP